MFLILIFALFTHCYCSAYESFTDASGQPYYLVDHVYFGFDFTVMEKVLEHSSFQSETSIVNPRILAGLEYSDYLFAYLNVGVASFRTDETEVEAGFKTNLTFYADFYDFKQYYGSLRFQSEVGFFYGEGKTGKSDLDAKVSYSEWNFMLLATSEYNPFVFYAGPLVTLTRGSIDPKGFDDISFSERNVLGLTAGITFNYGDDDKWKLTTEGRYCDYFSLSLSAIYSM